ncbi:formyltetrahydrofolate deformylase [Parvularcula sp. ZS-1/3]|uniref:Formyltetrahydrofolate deformylase n=1 Tax=Parvularcula mediterranea TaxID=2732508 RepID=A0A7Y3W6T6_9PROT|nr:formyltetrahydrofolate deformylase [Parvularcula mediterranea]NNU17616.1 formyltetrahydrofolate deformylase [Parvularcula mediterranea]
MAEPGSYILRTEAKDEVGILAGVTGLLAEHSISIAESHDFGDPVSGKFFIWVRMTCPEGMDMAAFEKRFAGFAEWRKMQFSIRPADYRPRVLLMASKMDHCLSDLLFRHRHDRLGAEVVGIVSNHDDARWHADRHDLPFHHIPVAKETKAEAEEKLLVRIEDSGADFVVLARYMQVLTDDLCRKLEGRCINIHHSALPSFKGARPYHQAYSRGVKLIGATAHYVTADLDEGPIIAQEAVSVDHRATPDRLIELGRDIEARVLARAVRAHAEGRVFMSAGRTVVFD